MVIKKEATVKDFSTALSNDLMRLVSYHSLFQ
ncbi:MAG: hypothetical protein ACI8P3_002556, partial [Saprospiraceae bacterium]